MEMFQIAVSDAEQLLKKHNFTAKGRSSFDPEAIPARRRFLARHVKLLRNLLRWRRFMGDQFGVGLVITRLVDNCILDVAESGWDIGGEEVAKNVST
jgi:GC-rich sequence DNA-binding factor